MREHGKRTPLTTEKLKKRFDHGPFDLVNHAISLAQNMVETGRAADLQNPADEVLSQIASGREQFLDPADVKERRETEMTKEELVKTVMQQTG